MCVCVCVLGGGDWCVGVDWCRVRVCVWGGGVSCYTLVLEVKEGITCSQYEYHYIICAAHSAAPPTCGVFGQLQCTNNYSTAPLKWQRDFF